MHLPYNIAGRVKSTTTLTLSYPDVVEDEFGNIGTWTLIYNQVTNIYVHLSSVYVIDNTDSYVGN